MGEKAREDIGDLCTPCRLINFNAVISYTVIDPLRSAAANRGVPVRLLRIHVILAASLAVVDDGAAIEEEEEVGNA